jgi:hypothetical protein
MRCPRGARFRTPLLVLVLVLALARDGAAAALWGDPGVAQVRSVQIALAATHPCMHACMHAFIYALFHAPCRAGEGWRGTSRLRGTRRLIEQAPTKPGRHLSGDGSREKMARTAI